MDVPVKDMDQEKSAAAKNMQVADALNPEIERAYQEGRLTVGDLGDFYSETGVAISGNKYPVIALVLEPDESSAGKSVKFAFHSLNSTRKISPLPEFEGGEHTSIGDNVLLRFSASDPGTEAYKLPLPMPNGLSLTYGQILALGGDFYGIPDKPISDGKSEDERRVRFSNALATLASDPNAKSEVLEILQVMQIEVVAVEQALAQGQAPSSVYKKLGDSLSEKWNKITGGGSIVSPWIPMGRYLKLAAKNWDHFSQCAVLAYTAGHECAIEAAQAARNTTDPVKQQELLMWAYVVNAFADHFLSDLFSSGHMRSPRKELQDNVTPSDTGGLLTRYMHDEDCANGLYVNNARGDSWKAYGDKRYLDAVNITNAKLVCEAVQMSATQVFEAFLYGEPRGDSDPLRLIPDLDKIQDPNNLGQNYSPMFFWVDPKLERRNDLNNVEDKSWTRSWWGWSTLGKLKATYKGPSFQIGPMMSPSQGPSIDSSGWQSSSAIPPNWVPGARVRYAVSFVNGLDETDPSPWGEAVQLMDKFEPTLVDVPVDPTNTATSRNIYRQFEGKPYERVGFIGNNIDTTYIDNKS